MYAQVLIDRPARDLDRAFTYLIPPGLQGRLRVGHYVLVPFGRQALPGFVIGFTETKGDFELKSLFGLLVDEPLFNERLLALAEWLRDYYVCSLAEAIRLLLPPGAGRKIRTVVSVTAEGQQPEALETLARAPRQAMTLRLVQALGPEVSIERLLAEAQREDPQLTRTALEGALAALERRGLLAVRRELARPAVQPLARQIVSLVEQEERDWQALLEDLQERAPRQAEIIAALLASADGSAAAADFSRPAIQALAQKGYVTLRTETITREPEIVDWPQASVNFLRLNEAQRAVYEIARQALERGATSELLVHGVTGSGKTEIYLHCVDLALRLGRTAIIVVPEIALTPQMLGRLRARFGKKLALLHSALGAGERFDEWQRAQRGEAQIVIGARSALFAPLRNVGVIVVDEAHERAYKQDQAPRYHAVEVARQRARLERAVLLLGSATPAVEHYWEAMQQALDKPEITGRGVLRLVELPQRIDNRPMPRVQLVDLRAEPHIGTGTTFSQPLLDAIADRLRAGEQIILFLNRRGFATFVICRECGYVLRCPDCEISLTFHYRGRFCLCHHCDYAVRMPERCPQCGSKEISFSGLGTERVADQVARLFPEAVVARMDRDTVAHKDAHGRILRDFATGRANVLVGTQMIAKGHDFPAVTLVGVLNADTALHRPDFRAAEHTFQLLTQVAGRAGRADRPGEVIVQTYNPDHYAIVTASRHDYLAFYQRELAARERPGYPPFSRLARLVVSAVEDEIAQGAAQRLRQTLEEMGVQKKEGPQCYLGPARAPLHKLRGRYRWSLLVKSRAAPLPQLIRELLQRTALRQEISVTVDIDPLDMM